MIFNKPPWFFTKACMDGRRDSRSGSNVRPDIIRPRRDATGRAITGADEDVTSLSQQSDPADLSTRDARAPGGVLTDASRKFASRLPDFRPRRTGRWRVRRTDVREPGESSTRIDHDLYLRQDAPDAGGADRLCGVVATRMIWTRPDGDAVTQILMAWAMTSAIGAARAWRRSIVCHLTSRISRGAATAGRWTASCGYDVMAPRARST